MTSEKMKRVEELVRNAEKRFRQIVELQNAIDAIVGTLPVDIGNPIDIVSPCRYDLDVARYFATQLYHDDRWIPSADIIMDIVDKRMVLDEAAEKTNALLRESNVDSCDFVDASFFCVESDDTDEIISLVFEDDDRWWSYYCYELDYGRAYEKGKVIDSEGEEISLSNVDELYCFLVKNKKQHAK